MTISSKLDIERIVIFLCGFFSTMPIVAISMGEHSVSLFTIVLFLELVIMLFYGTSQPLKLGKYTRYIFVWLVISLISLADGLLLSISYPEMENVISYLFKILIYLFVIVNWTGRKRTNDNNKALCRGLIYGGFVNILWGIIDATYWYLSGISLSNIVFSDYMRINHLKFIGLSLSNGLYRAGGFNHDPAHLGFICPFLTLYSLGSYRFYLLIIVFAGCVASASTTGIVCSGIIIGVWWIKRLWLGKITGRTVSVKRSLVLLIMILLICSVAYEYWEQLLNIAGRASNLFYNRVSSTYISANFGENIRVKFITFFPEALLRSGLFSLFGTGFGSSSFGYTHIPHVAQDMGYKMNSVFDIENTFLAYIFDTGIVGFFVFVFGVGKICVHYYRYYEYVLNDGVSITAYAGIVSMLLSFLFYHYIIFAPQVLLMIIAASNADSQKIMKCNSSILN